MLENVVQALTNFANIWIWLWIMGGVISGLIIGVLPGIGSVTGLALFLPFTFKLQPMEALPLMVSLASVGFTGGAITAILLGIPGETSSIPTTFDGYPMTKKGQGARAIGAAVMGSLLGGVAAAFLALAMMFAVLPMVMAVTSMDMVFVILIGLAFIGVLGKGSMIKGLISGGVGILISSVGLAVLTGEPRFTFGIAFLYDGIHIIPVALGMFAVPPMVDLALQGGGSTITTGEVIVMGMKDVWEGIKDVFRHWGLWLRSTIIGYIFGVIPGVGASVAVFVAYGQAKQTSKHPELFGTGIVEGVIAPESCDNAKEAGSLLTTLALGIPGSLTGAMYLGAMLMMGLIPGPEMITKHMDLSLTLLIVVAVSNIIAAGICFALAPHMAMIARIPGRVLVPTILVFIFAGCFAYRGYFEDIIVMVIFSVIGVAARRSGYNLGGFAIGYILGGVFENYLFISLQIGGPLFFLRPISLFLIFILIAFFAYSPLKNAFRIKRGEPKI